jgi:hypothetical protein
MTVDDGMRVTEAFSPNGPRFRARPMPTRQPEGDGFAVERVLSDRYRRLGGPYAPEMIVVAMRR